MIRNGSVLMSSNTGGNHSTLMPHNKGEGSNGVSTPVKVVARENSSMSSKAIGTADVSASSEVTGRDYGLLPSVDENMDVETNITAQSLSMSTDKVPEDKIRSSEFS